ncbi:MAG TPA: 8-oxo-dGTP diphosphatase [Candidatus Binatia bacterium]|nr:8-oxo-dGTP diphosphatase [Candidatus Binatia bacterium]
MSRQINIPRRVADLAWDRWVARDPATLVFVIRDHEMLLIHKKRGLGAGKINAPGGRVEPGETPLECAVREVQEELCTTPVSLSWYGENRFQFVDGYSIHVQIYRADGCDREPQETDEAIPVWVALDAIPYHCMWADDRLWVPLVIQRRRFSGRFIFDGDTMLDHAVELLAPRLDFTRTLG